ncbi:MAG: hypothetical protein PHG02_00545 [Oscillospiraceae bacterium]|nr:hypothetical protein [Oscillospiraceae bacterium]
MKKRYFDLLKNWCDSLLELQVWDTGQKRLDGGILCPACMNMHGRTSELVYPLLYLAEETGEEKYLVGAKRLFVWGENLLCDDGSMYNDAQSSWNGITVFAAAALCEALGKHGTMLDKDTKADWEKRLTKMAKWIYKNLTMEFVTNINYHAACAGVMALLGKYFAYAPYLQRAREMAASCLAHVTQEGLLYGEGKPMDKITPKGCRPVDIGYNAEESLPLLLLYARTMQDEQALRQIKEMLHRQLLFMLPDGGWDNSFGTRNFKWSYWGSRTSDGCQQAYGIWGNKEPVFAEAALRNLEQYKACTHNGLLYGGRDYYRHGEAACIHHTFSHAKALATALDAGVTPFKRCQLPSDNMQPVQYYPTLDTYRIHMGDFIADVTGYDFEYLKGGHTSGGTLSMLWHKKLGPVIMSSMVDYSLYEAHNMQLSTQTACCGSLTPRIFTEIEGITYSNCYDYQAKLNMQQSQACIQVMVDGTLCTVDQKAAAAPIGYKIVYTFTKQKVCIEIRLTSAYTKNVFFALPLIGNIKPTASKTQKPVFNLAGGFEAQEHLYEFNAAGELCVELATSS